MRWREEENDGSRNRWNDMPSRENTTHESSCTHTSHTNGIAVSAAVLLSACIAQRSRVSRAADLQNVPWPLESISSHGHRVGLLHHCAVLRASGIAINGAGRAD